MLLLPLGNHFTDNIIYGHRADYSAVCTVISVVSHYKYISLFNRIRGSVSVSIHILFVNIRLMKLLAVSVDPIGIKGNGIPGNPDHALYPEVIRLRVS